MSRRFAAGDLVFTSGWWPRPWCRVEQDGEHWLTTYGWTVGRARRTARDLAIGYGAWPEWVSTGTSKVKHSKYLLEDS